MTKETLATSSSPPTSKDKTTTPVSSEVVSKKEPHRENEQEPSLMHNLNVLALAASPEIRQMEEGRIKNTQGNEPPIARIGNLRKKFQAALESATPESQLKLHDYEMSTTHASLSKQRSSSNDKPVRSIKPRNRKTKSLAVISRRFLERLPSFPSVGDPVILSLNHLPTELGVERRRIYDILNILESVDMVRRLGRNQYQYLGYARLPSALADLRHQGQVEGLRDLIEVAEKERRDEIAEKRERRKREAEAVLAAEKRKQIAAKANVASRSSLSSAIELLASAAGKLECEESGVEEDEDESSSDESSSPPSPVAGDSSSSQETKSHITQAVRGSGNNRGLAGQTVAPVGGLLVADHNGMVAGGDDAASLGVICRRFLMLLLVSDPPVVTLNTAARVVGCQSSVPCNPRPAASNSVSQAGVTLVEKENTGPSSNPTSRYNSSTVFKSKLRRLYDVTNVLATVGLVKREVDGVPVDKDGAPSSATSSPTSSKETADGKMASSQESVKSEEKVEKAENAPSFLPANLGQQAASGTSSSAATSADKKLRGPVFRYTGPAIAELPAVSVSRLSELPSASSHRQGSHAKNSKCQLVVRNGSAVCMPPSHNNSPSLVLVPGNSKPMRLVASGSQSAASASSDEQRQSHLGMTRARTLASGLAASSSPSAVVMPSTPLLAPPRLANVSSAQSSSDGGRIRPNSLLGKLLGSQNAAAAAAAAATSSNAAVASGEQIIDTTSVKRIKAPTFKRMGLSEGDGSGFSAKQSRLAQAQGGDTWPTQERIVVIGSSTSSAAGGAAIDSRSSIPLIVSHAQLSKQHLQKPSSHVALNDVDDSEVVVVVQDEEHMADNNGKDDKIDNGDEFLATAPHPHNSVPGVKADVVNWLC